MSNAEKIILTQRLKCRNKVQGEFENSAGNIISKTAKAHDFVRFYFVSQSPTLFYNECLGKDSKDKYYKQAKELHLPKCPMPVFFVIDIKELLHKYPSKCHYSKGNMQKKDTEEFKVFDDPNHIKALEINDKYNKDARQQEFLVKDDIDLSSLSTLRIYCYDEYQCDMLKNLVATSPLKDRISCDESLFFRDNKKLEFIDNDNTLEIKTNYSDPYEFRISYDAEEPPEILNPDSINRIEDKNIYLNNNSFLQIKRNKPFTVYFEELDQRKASWKIYTSK